MDYYVQKQTDGWHLSMAEIAKIEDLKGATFVGSFCTKRPSDGTYNDMPVDVFYQPNPMEGHSLYFGIHRDNQRRVLICDAYSAVEEPLFGAVCDDGEVLISRARHDYVARKGAMVDGGRAYSKTNGCPIVRVVVVVDKYYYRSVDATDCADVHHLPYGTGCVTTPDIATVPTVPALPDSMTSTFKVVLSAEQEEDLRIQKEFLDPANREWEYDAAGVRVFKGTRTPFTGDMK